MRLFISGYSVGETYTIGMYDLGEEGKEKKLLWSSDVETLHTLPTMTTCCLASPKRTWKQCVYVHGGWRWL